MIAVERVVSRILWWGGVASIALMLIGLAGYAARVDIRSDGFEISRRVEQGQAGAAPNVFTSLRQVIDGLRRRPVDSLAITAVGLLALLGTPVVAVVAAIPVFLAQGDRRYALISTVLALALIGSLLLGGAG